MLSVALLLALPTGIAATDATSATSEACAPWPGEFEPLPTVADPDPLRARWARWRADQVARLATRMESRDRVEANRLWQRVLCLDPGAATAHQGVERTRPQVVLRAPEPRAEMPARPRPAPSRKKAAPSVAASPGAVAKPVVAGAEPPDPLGRAEEMIRAARFDDALGEIERLRPELPPAAPPAERARLELLAATAQVAFGDEAAARESVARALRADPGLDLDARSTPPKLLRVFEQVRGPSYVPAASSMRSVATP